MPSATQSVIGINFQKVMEGVDDATRRQVEDCLVFFSNDADTSATEEKNRADKLRTAYNTLVESLVSTKLNDLNTHQLTFLCSGALADAVIIQTSGEAKTVSLLPHDLYMFLLKIFSEPPAAPSPFPIFSVMTKFTAIAKGELLPLTMGDDRKKALRNSPQDQKRAKEEWKRRQDQLKSELSMSVGQLDIFFPKILGSLGETSVKNARISLEMMKKVTAAWGKGEAANPQEKAILAAFEGKVGGAGAGMSKWMEELYSYVGKVLEHSRLVDEKAQGMAKASAEIQRIDNEVPVVSNPNGPLFNSDTISSIKTDIDTTNSVSVRVAEASPQKVAFSASRVLVGGQFSEGENPEDRLCTPQSVSAALEKVLTIHTNLFPKDFEGKFIVPPILIEPLRNFVDFFQDRFIMSFVSGETARKGPFVNFNPAEVQVLKLCALYLTKDPIYDYRGDVKVGTFMGDYVGRIEKQTKVKWTGQEKKFSMAVTQSMQDTASRDDAIADYIDFLTAIANGTAPSPKLSKRKVNILLKYVLFDKLEKNIGAILRLVAQTDPAEAKESIMHFAKDDMDRAKDLIRSGVAADPLASKMFSDNADFAIARVFGR